MRMWMIDPAMMCRKHLQGEHGELHKLCGSLAAGNVACVIGLCKRYYLQPVCVYSRHESLEREAGKRGFIWNSPLKK